MVGYNVKIIRYPTETSIRLYSKEVKTSQKENKKTKNYKSVFTPDKDNEHAQTVSQNRSINKIYELMRSNMWEYFITLTFNPDKIDRFDYNACSGALVRWLNNIKHNYAPNLKYIISQIIYSFMETCFFPTIYHSYITYIRNKTMKMISTVFV